MSKLESLSDIKDLVDHIIEKFRNVNHVKRIEYQIGNGECECHYFLIVYSGERDIEKEFRITEDMIQIEDKFPDTYIEWNEQTVQENKLQPGDKVIIDYNR